MLDKAVFMKVKIVEFSIPKANKFEYSVFQIKKGQLMLIPEKISEIYISDF